MDDRELPQAGQIYRHFKGMLYQIIGTAKHSETGELLVVYQALYGDFGLYVRPLGMFMSETDHKKYPEVKQAYRFTKIDHSELLNDKKQEQKQEYTFTEHPEASLVDKDLMAFLDAGSYAEKLEILYAIKDRLTDRLMSDIESSLDLPTGQGTMEERLMTVRDNLVTMEKFECRRLR